MKKLLCILLMLILALPALTEGAPLAEEVPPAEDAPHDPFTLTVPEAVTREDNEGSATYVYGASRVVAIRIGRVPDDDPAEALVRMLGQFDPDAVIDGTLTLLEGYAGLSARTAGKFGEDIDTLTVMLLAPDGTLLILTAYDMDGSEENARTLLDTLLSGMTASGVPVVLKID